MIEKQSEFAAITPPLVRTMKEETEMDELKLILSTKFMRGIVTKILRKAIFKKTGYEIDILINKIEVETHDGKISLHMDANAEVNSEDFMDIIKSNGLI